MAAPSPVITEAAVNAGLVKGTLLTALIERTAYVLKTSEVLSDLSQSVGLIYNVVHSQATGFAYYYNASDTTTADDGFTCLVDADGHRYLIADGADLNVSAVISLTNTPPGSPVVGDSYIVGTSPTGAWAAHASDIAVWTLRGWVFAQPGVGQTVYRKDTDGNTQFNEAGNWVGFAISYTAGSIPNSALASMMGIAVEAQQNAPPGAPTTGQYYLVGTAGSGAWVGHNNDLAYWNGTAWEFYGEYEGATVYNKAIDITLNWNGSAWVGSSVSYITEYATPGSFSFTKPVIGAMVYIQMWAGGGSGGRAGTGDGGGGGGGGSYNEIRIPIASLAATETVTVGAGGAAQTTNDSDGVAGGNSSFGSWLTIFGGGGGRGNTGNGGGGGGGGGWTAVGTVGADPAGGAGGAGGPIETGGAGGAGGPATPGANGNQHSGGGGGGGISGATAGNAGGNAMWGGGGGAGGAATGGGGSQTGGNSYFGGAGGGGSPAGGGTGTGGTSVLGGAGGNGRDLANAAGAGVQPGGGGGGSCTGNSGKGGDGFVRVTVF